MKIAGFFTRKIGPLPAWAWTGIAALAVIVARHFTAGKTTATATGTDAGAAAGAGNAQSGLGAFGSGGGGDGGLSNPTDQGTADDQLGGPGTATVFDPTGGGDGSGAAPPHLVPYDTPPGNSQAKTGPEPQLVSEHGKGQNRPKSTRGQTATKKKKRVRGTGAAPNLVSEHGQGQATVPTARRAQQAATTAAHAPARSPSAAHPDTGARPVGTTTSAATYARMGRKMETG